MDDLPTLRLLELITAKDYSGLFAFLENMPEDRLRKHRGSDRFSYYRYQFTEAMREALRYAEINDPAFHQALFARLGSSNRNTAYYAEQILFTISNSLHSQQEFWLANLRNSNYPDLASRLYRQFVADEAAGKIHSGAVRAWLGEMSATLAARTPSPAAAPQPAAVTQPQPRASRLKNCVGGFSSLLFRRPALATNR